MKRRYEALLADHLSKNRQMIFLSGPRQVGKTTTAKSCIGGGGAYLNWDKETDQILFVDGADAIAKTLQLDSPAEARSQVVFDELHRYPKWKSFLKGFYDVYGEECRVIVTGSARLDIFKHGSDSLMGRYFSYRMHPFSVAELSSKKIDLDRDIQTPGTVDEETLPLLERFGGFPDPFLAGNQRFHNRWKKLRNEQLFREDLRDLSRVNDLARMRMLAELLALQSGQLVNYSTFAKRLHVSVDTIKNWISILESLYYSFSIRPWYTNVANSLRKQPKSFLWDWSQIDDAGARRENLVAAHLLKAVHWWTDSGLGNYGLYFLRDKMKREVDFLITKNQKPWIMVEVKSSANRDLSPALNYFSKQLGGVHALQVVFDLPYTEMDCFSFDRPVKVPVSSFLAQLI